MGLSERRTGDFLRARDPSEYVLSTKVGRLLRRPADPSDTDGRMWVGGLDFDMAFDYSRDGIMRAYEDSLQRLGLPRVDALIVHDLDLMHHVAPERVSAHLAQLATSGWEALAALRRSGEIGAIGVGINELGMIGRLLDLFDPDFFLVAMRYTLLDQVAVVYELPLCEERKVSVVAGAVFNSGILATGAVAGAMFDYQPASEGILERVRRIDEVCRRHDVPLAAAALQFPLAHPSVATVIPGGLSPQQVRQVANGLRVEIPPRFWSDLKAGGLILEGAPVPL
jgi:D-threo-aldose 1-dehydrogenase